MWRGGGGRRSYQDQYKHQPTNIWAWISINVLKGLMSALIHWYRSQKNNTVSWICSSQKIIEVNTLEWGPGVISDHWPDHLLNSPVKAKFCLAELSADIWYMMLTTNYVFTPSAPSSDTGTLQTLRYKCNLTNQHICELFQSSIQTNSTKQNPFCSLNINDQEDISAWIIFIAISIISSLVTLPPSQPSQVATLIFCLASRATIKTKIKPSKQRKLV